MVLVLYLLLVVKVDKLLDVILVVVQVAQVAVLQVQTHSQRKVALEVQAHQVKVMQVVTLLVLVTVTQVAVVAEHLHKVQLLLQTTAVTVVMDQVQVSLVAQ